MKKNIVLLLFSVLFLIFTGCKSTVSNESSNDIFMLKSEIRRLNDVNQSTLEKMAGLSKQLMECKQSLSKYENPEQ